LPDQEILAIQSYKKVHESSDNGKAWGAYIAEILGPNFMGRDVYVGDGQVSMFLKKISLSQMTRPNKLQCLSLEILSSQVLEFEGKARVNPIRAPSFLVKPLLLSANDKTRLKSDCQL
jgi:hypothetical protein